MVTNYWKQPQFSSGGGLINETQWTYTMKYYIVGRSAEFYVCTTTNVDIKNIDLFTKRREKYIE